MKVYLVIWVDYENSEVYKVFAAKEDAVNFIENFTEEGTLHLEEKDVE